MPTYDFECATCGGFRVITAIEQRNAPRACPRCGTIAERIAVAPALALMPATRRFAETTHERSRHEPRLAKAAAAAARAADPPSAAKTFPGKRPWMISH